MPRRHHWLAAALAVLVLAQIAHARPAAYSEFTPVTDPTTLAALIDTEDALYLPDGNYTLDNPVVISRTTPLFIHGANRNSTRLFPLNPALPLFEIQAGTVINFTNLNLRNDTQVDARALHLTNAAPLTLELVEVRLRQSVLEIQGPATVRMQGVHLAPGGFTTSPVLVDHPDADVVIVGGNCSNGGATPLVSGPDQHHVWAKQGRLRIYSMGVQGALGKSDFRIDAPSALGAHVIANVRSEGANGFATGLPSRMLTVPPTSARVDIVMKNNAGSWFDGPLAQFVDYNAAGRLWLLGNNSDSRAETLVTGIASGGTVIAVGNRTEAIDPIETTGALEIEVHNLYRDDATSVVQFTSPDDFADRPFIPLIPDIAVPAAIPRPVVDVVPSGMLDVTTFGAIPDDGLDDLAAIQAAFDVPVSGRNVYFPAGTYHVSGPIQYNHSASPVIQATGGWIAGAGSDTTQIVRMGSGTVFETDGMAYNTVQGLTFQTAPWNASAPTTDVVFAIDNVNGVGHASQEIMFHDVVFDGGHVALGIGLDTPTQCSENLMVDVSFRNAQFGLGIGSFNALANVVYGGTWTNNEINAGHTQPGHGGTWAILGGLASGTLDRDFQILGTARGVWYFEDYESDAAIIYQRAWTSASYPVWFERARLGFGATVPVDYSYTATAGPIFLRSSVDPVGLDLTLDQGTHAGYALNLYSDIPGWDQASEGTVGHVDELELPAVPSMPWPMLALLALGVVASTRRSSCA